jgi:hypothetical protein
MEMNNDVGAGAGQLQRDLFADAMRRACDQSRFAVEIHRG